VESCNDADDDCDGVVDNLAESSCSNDNEWGSCQGVQVCGQGGEAICDAQIPGAESCNGEDDDCDGMVDEQTCNDGLECTIDSCTADGMCLNTPQGGSCLIDGACFLEGMTNPMDPCMGCVSALNSMAWSSLEGQGCNDGDPCTKSDTCSGGLCSGTLYVCNDGLNCTGDSCDGEGGCSHPIAAGYCTVDGLCWADGQLSPGNTCKLCSSEKLTKVWSNAPSGIDCNDGEACTADDKCSPGGSCSGNFQSCNDGQWCTADSCDGLGGCSNVPSSGCLIAGICYQAGEENPNNPCEICSIGLNKTGWSAANGKPCSDGQSCTYGDSCQAGACIGIAYSCSDDLACTTDTCNGQGGCTNTTKAGKCLINGICYATGNPNPNNGCEVCSNAKKWGWSDNDGAWCSDANACTENDTCSGGQCVSNYKVDNYEGNNTKGQAYNLGSVNDNEDYPKGSFSATLYGPGDQDWYRFYDNDKWNGQIYPRVDLKSIPVGSNYKLCAYFSCSGVSVSCKSGTYSTYNGLPGCCSNNGGNASEKVRLDNNCNGADDSGDVYVVVTRTSGSWTCDSYTLEWGDD
jgi:hypothetical protein